MQEFKVIYDRIELNVEQLEKVTVNLRKSPNTKFTERYLIERDRESIVTIKQILSDIKQVEKRFTVPKGIENEIIARRKRARIAKKFIEGFVKVRLGQHFFEVINLKQFFEMGESYKYSEAKALPELKSVETHTAVRDFLAVIKGYHDTLKDEDKPTLIKFVIATKILSDAKTKIGEGTGTTTFAELSTLIHTKCKGPESQATLLKKLNDVQQAGKSVEDFAAEVKEITARLLALDVANQNLSTSQQEAVKVFKFNGNCNKCRKPGHLAKDCRSKEAKEGCFVCGKPNHRASECRNRWKPNQQNNTQGVVCYKCQKQGHKANVCRSGQPRVFQVQGEQAEGQGNAQGPHQEFSQDLGAAR